VADYGLLGGLLQQANFPYDPTEFKRVASKRSLYHWNADANQEY
jgi:methylamine---glutamate N-methyltransferase subunit B